MKRIKVVLDHPNPLFEEWLEEWYREAVKKNLKTQFGLAKALESLRKYPVVLKTGKECILLQYFGEKLCQMLDKKLERHKKLTSGDSGMEEKRLRLENNTNDGSRDKSTEREKKKDDGIRNREKLAENKKVTDKKANKEISSEKSQSKENERSNRSNTEKDDWPKVGSGEYAILLALYKGKCFNFMYKKDLIVAAERDPGIQINKRNLKTAVGWKAMTELTRRNLVKQNGDPVEYSLTPEGVKLGKKLSRIDDLNRSKDYSEKEKSKEVKNKDEAVKHDVIVLDDDDDNNCIAEEFNANHKTELANDVDDDEEFKRFCEENKEPVITFKKTVRESQEFIFNTVMGSLTLESQGTSSNSQSQQEVNKVPPSANTAKKKAAAKQKDKAAISDYEEFFLLPNNFDVILLVDTQETGDGSSVSELTKLKVMHEVRSLKVGDFTWIAKCQLTNKELVLPYIVERKRIDDLAASIKDGRYKEQKHRLRQCGLDNVIYMIENFDKTYHGSIPFTSLSQAACNSMIEDDFIVKYTKDLKHSMNYLATMTKQLTKNYESKELISCKKKDLEESKPTSDVSNMVERLMEFGVFNKASVKTKNYSVKEMLIRQLVQLKGMSNVKAIAIADRYPTPKVLAEAFKKHGEKMVADVTVSSTNRKIGPVISTTLYQFYSNYNLK